jgi:hypothetical protein
MALSRTKHWRFEWLVAPTVRASRQMRRCERYLKQQLHYYEYAK